MYTFSHKIDTPETRYKKEDVASYPVIFTYSWHTTALSQGHLTRREEFNQGQWKVMSLPQYLWGKED